MSGLALNPEQRWAAARLTAAPGPLVLVVVGLAYLTLAQLMLALDGSTTGGVTVWPSAGLGLAALLLLPADRWAWAVGAMVLAELGGDLAWGHPVGTALGWTAASTVGPLLGALSMRRLGNPAGDLVPVRRLLVFLGAGAVVAPATAATLRAAVDALSGTGPFIPTWSSCFLGHVLGVLVVAPALLAPRCAMTRTRAELVGLLGWTGLVTAVVFAGVGGSWMVTLPYVLVPFFVWAALRFGTAGTAATSLVVTTMAGGFTAAGLGPFAQAGAPGATAVTQLQVFLGVTVSFSLLLAALVSDLTERRDIEETLRHQATHDALTGLPNRTRFQEAVEAALEAEVATDRGTGLLVCDLDLFKSVNDRVGHKGGDELLVAVAQRLRAGVRAEDLVARMSGDEFVVLLADVDADTTQRVARRLVEAVGRPVALEGRGEVRTSMSVGAALAEPGESPDSLFRTADAALYRAKRRGRGRVVVVDDNVRRQAETQIRVEDEIPAALAEGQIVCHFQPVVDIGEGMVTAAEATVLWRHPGLGLLDAERFLPAVEAMGWGDQLFETVLDRSLEAQADWTRQTGRRLPVGVKPSALQLGNGAALNALLRVLTESDTPPDALWVEVSTAQPLDDMGVAALHQLHALGVHLVLDRFGVGWSSMDRVRKVPWDLLKIDRSFVTDLGSDPAAADAVRAMAAMTRTLGISIAAEGVSRLGQLELLREAGCRLAQGPLFGRPECVEEIGRLMAADRVWPAEELPA